MPWFVSSLLIVAMVGRIQLLRSVQESYRVIGVVQSNENSSLNWRCLFILFGLHVPGAGLLAFMVFKAKSVFEFGTCFYGYVTIIASTAYFLFQLWKVTNISKLIGSLEEFMAKSKYQLNFILHTSPSKKKNSKLSIKEFIEKKIISIDLWEDIDKISHLVCYKALFLFSNS